MLFLILALTSFLAGPLIFGLYLKPKWGGVGIGFIGLIGEFGSLLFLLPSSLGLLSLVHIWPFETLGFLLFSCFGGLGGIVIMLLVAGKLRSDQERMGIGLAIVIWIGMSIGLAAVPAIGASNREGSSVEYLSLYLPFLWIWLNAVFFPELLSRRTDWRGIFIWIAIMLTFTFLIAIIILGVLPVYGF